MYGYIESEWCVWMIHAHTHNNNKILSTHNKQQTTNKQTNKQTTPLSAGAATRSAPAATRSSSPGRRW